MNCLATSARKKEWSTKRADIGQAFEPGLISTAGFEAAVRALAERQLTDLDRKRSSGAYVPAAHYVFAHVRAGNSEDAFAWLPKMVAEPNWFALQLRVNPSLDPLRDDPRLEKIVESLVLK